MAQARQTAGPASSPSQGLSQAAARLISSTVIATASVAPWRSSVATLGFVVAVSGSGHRPLPVPRSCRCC